MIQFPSIYIQVFFALAILCTSKADDLPPGVVDTQDPNDISLSPEESLSRITAPEGFHVTLFAGEPDLRRPIAFDFDDRGRLWVVENYSHPYFERETGSDRILILEDADHDGRFDKRTVFWDKGRYLSGIAIGHGGVWIANTPAKLAKRLLYYFLTGNEDMHLKNFSLQMKAGIVTLSQAYDLITTTLVLENAIEESALPLKGKKNKLTKQLWLTYFCQERLKLPNSILDGILHDLEVAIPKWTPLLERCHLSPKRKESYAELLQERLTSLGLITER
jgi:hypothetical protein